MSIADRFEQRREVITSREEAADRVSVGLRGITTQLARQRAILPSDLFGDARRGPRIARVERFGELLAGELEPAQVACELGARRRKLVEAEAGAPDETVTPGRRLPFDLVPAAAGEGRERVSLAFSQRTNSPTRNGIAATASSADDANVAQPGSSAA